MSAYAPSNLAGGPTQRHPDLWQPVQSQAHSTSDSHAHTNGHGIGDTVSGFFGADRREELPMYKDKPARGKRGPYTYPGDTKIPWWRRRRAVALLLTSMAVLSWWFGFLSPLSWFTRNSGVSLGVRPSEVGWDARAEKVKQTFKISFDGYEKYGWGSDEYHPVSKSHKQMSPNGLGWIIVDALDTMMLMNLTSELSHARQWIHDSLFYDQDQNVNTFETTIRMLGGLLSAHYLSTAFPGTYAPIDDEFKDDLYIEKATDLADRLLGAYNSESGIPFASVNLRSRKGVPSHTDGGASSTAEATSLQLEMKYLAKLTGEDHYWDTAEHVMKVVDDNNAKDGLVPIYLHPDTGTFRGGNVRLGSRGDSYYEYLIKQYLQTSGEEPVYLDMWNQALKGIKKWLVTYSYPSNFTIIAERPQGLSQSMVGKMDHLVCFMPGTIALATTGGLPLAEARKSADWGPKQEEDMTLAAELMNTCWGMYKVAPSGLAGEITHFHMHSPPLMYNEFLGKPEDRPHSPAKFDRISPGHDFAGRDDYLIKTGDAHNLQRPETVESLFYMWRITGEERYRDWGWEMFSNFVKWTAVPDGTGYSSLSTVLATPPPLRDNMESFWLAETLKYFYLLFAPSDILPLTDVVFNTEGHAFPRFQLGKLFSTGWSRKLRDTKGNLLTKPMEHADEPHRPVVTDIADVKNVVLEDKEEMKARADLAALVSEMEAKVKAGTVLDPVTGKEKKIEV